MTEISDERIQALIKILQSNCTKHKQSATVLSAAKILCRLGYPSK